MHPLELQQMAVRIERLVHTGTHGWHPADELEFRNLLPMSRVPDPRRKLPDPKVLREMAQGEQRPEPQEWQQWQHLVRRAEDLIRDNDPRNPRRIMRDMARGRFPTFR